MRENEPLFVSAYAPHPKLLFSLGGRVPHLQKSGTLYVFLSTAYGDSRQKYPSTSPISRITSAVVEDFVSLLDLRRMVYFVDAEPVTR
jgi:hypothetical protein